MAQKLTSWNSAWKDSDHLGLDFWLLIPVLLLMGVGMLMVASASMVISEHVYHTPFHFIIRHSIYLVLSLGVLFFFSRVPSRLLQEHGFLLLLICLAALVLVLVPGIGRMVNGSRRWIALPFITIQVSEFAKWVSILFVANYITRQSVALRSQSIAFARPLLLLVVFIVLLLLEPDFGTVSVLMLTTLGMLFLAGAPLRPFIIMACLVALALIGLIYFSPYRWERLISFMNPWSKQFGSGYQLTQSLIAFGRGGVTGVGLGESMQKLFYLPEAHTDFLFAVLTEELGLVGATLTISFYVVLVARLFWWGRQLGNQDQLFPAFYCYGIALWFAIQAAVNTGVTMGLLPTKGLTLPFISYGGTSLLVSAAAIGFALGVIREHTRSL